MFQMKIEAGSMTQLRERLLKAANAIDLDKVTEPYAPPVKMEATEKDAVTMYPDVGTVPKISVDGNPVQEAMDFANKITPTLPPPNKIDVTTAVQALTDMVIGELDSRGIPWDARIHSTSKAKVKDGSWRVARNKDPKDVAIIEAELIASRGTTPVAPIAPPPFVTPQATPVIPSSPVENLAPAQAVAQALAQPAYAAPIAVPAGQKPAHDFNSFKANFASVLNQLATEGKLTADYIKQLCEYFHIDQIWQVVKSDNDSKLLFNQFVDLGFITKVE